MSTEPLGWKFYCRLLLIGPLETIILAHSATFSAIHGGGKFSAKTIRTHAINIFCLSLPSVRPSVRRQPGGNCNSFLRRDRTRFKCKSSQPENVCSLVSVVSPSDRARQFSPFCSFFLSFFFRAVASRRPLSHSHAKAAQEKLGWSDGPRGRRDRARGKS